jgi:argininosuccinate lyase
MLEALSSSATLFSTFSRLAEELILWASWEFQSITLDDGFAMGSSMMPQKKNPGVLVSIQPAQSPFQLTEAYPQELLRGRAGRMNGLMVAGFTLMKVLPGCQYFLLELTLLEGTPERLQP